MRWNGAGRIVGLGRLRRGSAVEDVCVFPGLVDAHTHLQIEPVEAPREFVPWVRAVMGARQGLTSTDFVRSARGGALRLLAEGVTAVGEIDSSGVSPGALASTPLAGRCYQELTGFDLDASGARQRIGERRRPGNAVVRAGLSPHAPYSVSASLFRASAAASHRLAIHCAETPAEQEFLHRGRGPFAELLAELGRLPDGYRAPGVGAVRWLDQLGVLRASTQLVHCQELETGDLERIRSAGASVVVCPGTIRWFGRQPPPVPRWLREGVPVALGTDSRASNESWSLRGALTTAAEMWPELPAERLLSMATAGGGRALFYPGLGRLRVGGRADLFAVSARGDAALGHVEPLVRGDLPVKWVLGGGRWRKGPCHACR